MNAPSATPGPPTDPSDTGNIWYQPRDAANFKANINIDFTLTTTTVLRQTPRTFTGVTMKPGPDYSGVPGDWFPNLLDRVHAGAISGGRPESP